MLGPAAVLVIEGRQDELVSLELALLHAGQGWRGGVPPLGDEDNEGERLAGALQQFLVQEEKEQSQHWLSNDVFNESYRKEMLLQEQCPAVTILCPCHQGARSGGDQRMDGTAPSRTTPLVSRHTSK